MARLVSLVAISVTVIAVGCGGSGNNPAAASGGQRARTPLNPSRGPSSQTAVATANANCRSLRVKIRQLGRGTLPRSAGSPTTLQMRIIERVAVRSIPALEGIARRQQALEPAVDDPNFNLYANLFDPITVMAEQILSSVRAHQAAQLATLESLLTSLNVEQMNAARAAGLSDCDKDFEQIATSSIT